MFETVEQRKHLAANDALNPNQNPCFWVAFIFERMTFVDLCESPLLKTLPNLPKMSVSKGEIGSITSPACMSPSHAPATLMTTLSNWIGL